MRVSGGEKNQAGYPYEKWIQENEPDQNQLLEQTEIVSRFKLQPVISILTPVYNPPPNILEDTINSVLNQSYPNWEFCLVNGCSTVEGVKEVLEKYSNADSRIRVNHLSANLGIAENTNTALRMAHGEFVLLLDHDDLLAPDLLFEVVNLLNHSPDSDIIYYDEDKISEEGSKRLDPWFKPSRLSPDLLISTNYLMHSVIRRKLIEQAGEFDPQMDGAQDWDMSLRLIEKTIKIHHIPKIFYHWRQVPGSASREANAKPWAFDSQARCVQAALSRAKMPQAKVTFAGLGVIKILWPFAGLKISIIIPTKNSTDLLKPCISSIFKLTTYPDYEIILVDNASEDPTTLDFYAELRSDPRVCIIDYPAAFNYHVANNLGAAHAQGDIFVFLNNDTEILEPGWLEELAGWASQPEIGIVGAKLLRQDGSIQHGGIIIGLAGHGSHVFEGGQENLYGPYGSTEWYRNFQAVTGACMAMKRVVFTKLGGFDEDYQVGYGDIDICLRAFDEGYRILYTPFVRINHYEGGTRGFSQPASDVLRATIKMLDRVVQGDPFYNPNLSDHLRVPAIASPNDSPRIDTLLKILYDYDLIGREDIGGADGQRWQISLPDRSNQPEPPLKQRLLLISHELSRSGAPITLFLIANFLSKRGYLITVLSPFEGPLREDYENANMRVCVIPSILEDARLVVSYLDQQDLVLANTILAYRLVHAAKAFNKVCIWWIHESGLGQKWAKSLPAVAQALSLSDSVIFPSQATADLYVLNSPRSNYLPIHLGIDINDFQINNCKIPVEDHPGKMLIVNVASLETRKGQDVLLKAIQELPADIRGNIECYLIGQILSETEKNFCEKIQRIADHMDNVFITGPLPHDQVVCYLMAADIFILTSRDEALPLSMIEAMSFGKAIISTNVGGISEIIQDGVNGLLVSSENHRQITNCLMRLYRNPAEREQLGATARQTYLENYTFDRFAKQILDVIRSVGGSF